MFACALPGLLVAPSVGATTTSKGAKTQLSPVEVAQPGLLPHQARDIGPLPSSRSLQISIALTPRDSRTLANMARSISTPGSSLFHRYLSPTDIARDFGPTPSMVHNVEHTLVAMGLHLSGLSANHLLLDVTGSVGQISKALQAKLVTVRLPGGQPGWRLASTATIPGALAHEVSAVIGLNNLSAAHAMSLPSTAVLEMTIAHSGTSVAKKSSKVSASPRACRQARSVTGDGGGWTDNQVAAAYGLSPLYGAGDLAAGQTIAVVELEPLSLSDIANFDRCYFGESHVAQVHRISLGDFASSGTGMGESALDVETIAALAPAANIDVYQAPNTTIGTLDIYNAIVSQDKANIVTTSWGECEQLLDSSSPGTRQIENYLFEEAAAQGQTFIAATGDSGSDDCATTPFGGSRPVAPYLSVDDPASQPYVLAVGGTSLHRVRQPLSSVDETAWNDGAEGGASGGGVSSSWASPTWQSASGVPGVSTNANRQVPDVSASADSNSGITVYSSGFGKMGWTTIGGTSVAAPIWAAVLAEIAASGTTGTSCSSLSVRSGGSDLGFVSPLVYEAAASSYSTSFHPISTGTNDAFGLGHGYLATGDFNLVDGLGSPKVTNPGGEPGLAVALCNAATSQSESGLSRPTVLSMSPTYGPLAGGTAVSLTLTQPLTVGASVRVSFGGVGATVLNAVGSTITVISPAAQTTQQAQPLAAAGAALVSVTEESTGGSITSSPSPLSIFEYVNESATGVVVPSVSGINPSAGNISGGDTITIYGSGFGGATPTVSVGGQVATDVHVISDFRLTAVVPPEQSSTICAVGTGFDPTNLCQTQVVVADADGNSATSLILPTFVGRARFNALGSIVPTPNSEIAPIATEYDYAPTPSITRITPNPSSPRRGTVRIFGHGFSINTFYWVNIGSSRRVNSQQTRISSITPGEIEIRLPSALSRAGKSLPGGVSVQTASGLSRSHPLNYAGRPKVLSVSPSAGDQHGRRSITVRGTDLAGVQRVLFVSETQPYSTRTVRNVSSMNQRSLQVMVPAGQAGPVDVEPCTSFGCATANRSTDTYLYLSSARPMISRLSFAGHSGSSMTTVTIFGSNLAGVIAVKLGPTTFRAFVNSDAIPRGDPSVCIVEVPLYLATVGTSVEVVTTVGTSAARTL